jgi:hypothetical protein
MKEAWRGQLIKKNWAIQICMDIEMLAQPVQIKPIRSAISRLPSFSGRLIRRDRHLCPGCSAVLPHPHRPLRHLIQGEDAVPDAGRTDRLLGKPSASPPLPLPFPVRRRAAQLQPAPMLRLAALKPPSAVRRRARTSSPPPAA